jgi:hypothetical protein
MFTTRPSSRTYLIQRIQPQVGVTRGIERSTTEGLDLGVQRGADATDLPAGKVGDTQRRHQVLDATRRHAADVGLLHHAQQCPLGTAPRLEQAREVAALTQPGDVEIEAADAGVPASLAIPVALGAASLGGSLAVDGADLGRHLGLHQRLAQHAHSFAQQVDVAVGCRLAQQLEQVHPVIGHRVNTS